MYSNQKRIADSGWRFVRKAQGACGRGPQTARLRSRGLLQLVLLAALTFSTLQVSAAESLDLAQFRGKVVLVDFWASWCEPCRRSFPWLNELQAKYRDRLVVIGVNVDRERSDADRFLREIPAQFQMLYDPRGALATDYKVMGMPSSYVFDPAGRLVSTHIGFRKGSREEREAELQKLLRASNAQKDEEAQKTARRN